MVGDFGMSAGPDHDAPLRDLIQRRHARTTLRERVVGLRWKRKRAASGVQVLGAETEFMLDDLSHGERGKLPIHQVVNEELHTPSRHGVTGETQFVGWSPTPCETLTGGSVHNGPVGLISPAQE